MCAEMQSLRQALGRGALTSSLASSTHGAWWTQTRVRAIRTRTRPHSNLASYPSSILSCSDLVSYFSHLLTRRPSRDLVPVPGLRVFPNLRALRVQEARRLVLQRPRLEPQVPGHQKVRRRTRRGGGYHRAAARYEVVVRRELRNRRGPHGLLPHFGQGALHGRARQVQTREEGNKRRAARRLAGDACQGAADQRGAKDEESAGAVTKGLCSEVPQAKEPFFSFFDTGTTCRTLSST